MIEHTLFYYYPYVSFMNTQLPLMKVVALWFDKLVILDPVSASWDTIGADHVPRDAARLLQSVGILEPAYAWVNAMNPNLNRRDDGKVLKIIQAQGRRDGVDLHRHYRLNCHELY
ncbi:hypothetical protein [Roseiflexus sp.]